MVRCHSQFTKQSQQIKMNFKVLTISVAFILIACIASSDQAGDVFRKNRRPHLLSAHFTSFLIIFKTFFLVFLPVKYCLSSNPLADCISDCRQNGHQGGYCDQNDNCLCQSWNGYTVWNIKFFNNLLTHLTEYIFKWILCSVFD